MPTFYKDGKFPTGCCYGSNERHVRFSTVFLFTELMAKDMWVTDFRSG